MSDSKKITLKDLKDFDWKFYIENNSDLKKKRLDENRSKLHWIKYEKL